MTHEDVRARFSDLVDGVLGPPEASAVAAHLEVCAACRADLEQLRATIGVLRGMEPLQAPEGFAAAVRGRLERMDRPTLRWTWNRFRAAVPAVRWSWRAAAAATAVALVGIFAVNVLREVVPLGPARRDFEAQQPPASSPAPRILGLPAAPGAGITADRTDPGRMAQQIVPPGDAGALRRVVRTGHVHLEVEAFDDSARRLLTIAEEAGGFVAESSFSQGADTPRGTFTLRVPAARFADVMRQVEALGTVQRRQVSGQDVTEEYVDLEARIRNLERQEARLLSFMERATKIPDLMAIESEVARVRGEIERLTGRVRFLANRVDLATIQAEVAQKPKAQPGGLWDFQRTFARVQAAFVATVRQMLAAVEGVATTAAALLPVGLVAALGWGAARQIIARRASRPL